MKSQFVAVLLGITILSFAGCTKSKKDPANTVQMYSVAKIKTLDPALSEDIYSGREISKGYEGLLQYHYLKRPFVLIPNLAEAMPQVSADGRTVTFKLKKQVLFHDDPCFKETGGKGREMNAEDVVYSFKRLADPKVASTGWWILDGKLVGVNEWRDRSAKAGTTDYTQTIEGIKAIDRYTVQFKLIKPSAQFLYVFAMPYTGIVAREAVEMYGQEFINHPVGTGPFRLEEYNPSSKVVWVRNPTYRRELYPSEGMPGDKEAGLLEDAGKPLPLADKIVTTIYIEDQPRWLNFMAGKLDFTIIPKDSVSSALNPDLTLKNEMKEKGIRLTQEPKVEVTHETFNLADPVLGKNKLLRQALSMSVDPEIFLDLFYNRRARSAQGPIPPGIHGYDPKLKNPYRVYNVEKAKELLAKAGYPGGKGLTLEYLTYQGSTARQMAEFFQKSFAALGVQLNIVTYTWPEFQQSLKQKKGQMWGHAWGADYPDAENFLQLFYSKNASPGPNDSNYSNPEYDKLYEKSLVTQSAAERLKLYQQMVKMVIEDCPWIFGVHRVDYAVVHPWLKNLRIFDMEHSIWKYLRVDPSLKK